MAYRDSGLSWMLGYSFRGEQERAVDVFDRLKSRVQTYMGDPSETVEDKGRVAVVYSPEDDNEKVSLFFIPRRVANNFFVDINIEVLKNNGGPFVEVNGQRLRKMSSDLHRICSDAGLVSLELKVSEVA
ncbi:MAG: hypothetical protein Q7R56_02460 [Nanoarchaeota archaeon]|nr:hypothetical protein [Nanoarchaeota archaeon]